MNSPFLSLLANTSVRNTLIYLTANVSNAALPLLLLPFLTRKLGAEGYGEIGLFFSFTGVMTALIGAGTAAYLRHSFFKSSPEQFKDILWSIHLLVLAAFAGLLGLTALLSASPLAPPIFSWPLISLALVGAVSQFLITLRLALWQMREQPVSFGLFLVFCTASNLVVSILLVFVFELGWEGRVYGHLLPTALLGWGAFLYLAFNRQITISRRPKHIGAILRYSLPLVPHSLAATAIIFLERASLLESSGAGGVGIYFAAFQLSLPLAIVATSLNLQFRTWSFKHMENDNHLEVVRVSYQIMILLCILAVLYSVCLFAFYQPVVGGDLIAGRIPAMILTAATLFHGMYLVVAKGLLFTDKSIVLMSITVPLSIVYGIAVFQMPDITSVALLHLAHAIAVFVVTWIAANRYCPQPWLKGFGTLFKRG